jgi:hypothetical protein
MTGNFICKARKRPFLGRLFFGYPTRGIKIGGTIPLMAAIVA